MMMTVYEWFETHQRFIDGLQNDIFTISLSFIGIAISVFTLLFSFISNKRQIVVEMKDRINNGDKDPLLISRYKHGLRYIKRLGNLTKTCIILLCCSTLLCIFSWINFRIIKSSGYICLFNLLLLTGIAAYAMYIIYKVYLQFKKEIRL